MLYLSKQKRNIMKKLINILSIIFICIAFIHCSKNTSEKITTDDIKGTWKLHLSHNATDTFYYNDLRGVRITDSIFYDCGFLNQFSPYMGYEYTYIDGIIDIRHSSYIFGAKRVDDCLIFVHQTQFVNIFVPYSPAELDTVLAKGCFQ